MHMLRVLSTYNEVEARLLLVTIQCAILQPAQYDTPVAGIGTSGRY